MRMEILQMILRPSIVNMPVCCKYEVTTITMYATTNDMLIVDFDVGSDTIGRTSGCRDDLQPTMFHMEGFDTNDGQMMMMLTIHWRSRDLFTSLIFALRTQDRRGVLEDILRLT